LLTSAIAIVNIGAVPSVARLFANEFGGEELLQWAAQAYPDNAKIQV